MLQWEGAGAAKGERLCSHGRGAVLSKEDDVMLSKECGLAPMGGRRCCQTRVAVLPWERSVAVERARRCYECTMEVLPRVGGGAVMGGRWCCHGRATVL